MNRTIPMTAAAMALLAFSTAQAQNLSLPPLVVGETVDIGTDLASSWLTYSTAGPGATCPGALSYCLDIDSAQLLGSTDASGVLTTPPIPEAAAGDFVWMQAGDAAGDKTNTVRALVARDTYSVGVTSVETFSGDDRVRANKFGLHYGGDYVAEYGFWLTLPEECELHFWVLEEDAWGPSSPSLVYHDSTVVGPGHGYYRAPDLDDYYAGYNDSFYLAVGWTGCGDVEYERGDDDMVSSHPSGYSEDMYHRAAYYQDNWTGGTPTLTVGTAFGTAYRMTLFPDAY